MPTSIKPQAEILKLNNVNGCNDISFGDHSILKGDRIPPLKSHGQALALLLLFLHACINRSISASDEISFWWLVVWRSG